MLEFKLISIFSKIIGWYEINNFSACYTCKSKL